MTVEFGDLVPGANHESTSLDPGAASGHSSHFGMTVRLPAAPLTGLWLRGGNEVLPNTARCFGIFRGWPTPAILPCDTIAYERKTWPHFVTSMSSEPILSPLSDPTMPLWYRSLQDLKVLVWPTAVAIVTALIHFIGAATLIGRARALAILAISRSASGADLYVGAGVLLALVSPATMLLLTCALGWHVLRFLAKKSGGHYPARIARWWHRTINHFSAKWIVLFVIVVSAGVISVYLADLLNSADGLILKRANETEASWLRIQLDEDGAWFGIHSLAFGAWLGGSCWLSRWLAKRFDHLMLKVAFIAWAVVQSCALVFVYAMISGAAQTVQSFPLISFANQDAVIGPDAVSFLIGADDKQYALFVVYGYNGLSSERGKSVLYVPRSEVKWMKILEYAPLHRYGYYRDFKEHRLSGQ